MTTKTEQWLRTLRLRKAHSRTPSLGERELAVLNILWADSELTVSEVHNRMGDSDISVNTIQSTLERLVRKNLLTRQKQARAYLYSAAVSRATLISSLLRDIRRDVAGGEMVPMVSGFAEFLAEDGDLLQREHSDE